MFTDGKSKSGEKVPTLHSEWQEKDGQFGLRWSEFKSYLPPFTNQVPGRSSVFLPKFHFLSGRVGVTPYPPCEN